MSSAGSDSMTPGSGDDATLALLSYRQGDVLPEVRSLAMLRVKDDTQLGFLARLLDRTPGIQAATMLLRTASLFRRELLHWEQEPTPNGVVLISQTCDVVRPHRERPTVQAAKLTQLQGAREREAVDGRRPRFVAVPNEGTGWFADLEVVGTIHKLALVRLSHRAGIVGDDQVRRFADGVGRRFSRFPFPDEVTEQTSPLVKEVQEKYSKEASPLGQVLRQVLQLRLGAHPRWDDPDAVITLFVICDPGVLPTFDEPPDAPADLAQWLQSDAAGVAARLPSEIAKRLLTASPGSVEVWHLWDQLGRVWARRCSQVNPRHGTGRPHQFASEVLSADEFTLDRVRSTEILDVDHLSPPTSTETSSLEDEAAR